MSLAAVSEETLAIVKRGSYRSPAGKLIEFGDDIDAAMDDTILYTPSELAPLLRARQPTSGTAKPPKIEVTSETTAQAARRLLENEGEPGVAALNFASARKPGGGFLGEAKAQEEDLARCSALYDCLLTQPRYYEANRAFNSTLYTDHLIYSPKVPFFRDDQLNLIDQPFYPSILTSPAPNAGEFLRSAPPQGLDQLRTTLERRASMILSVAAEQGERVLVLGAWGCGVFRNTPADVAKAFAHWLNHPGFAGAFDRVVFAIYERDAARPLLAVFKQQLGA